MLIDSKVKNKKGESHSLILSGEVMIKEAEDAYEATKEEDLVEEEDLSYVTIVIILDT